MTSNLLPLHIKIASFIVWAILVISLRKYLDKRYGVKKKKKYKRAICEIFIGISLIFFWKVLKEDWLTIGIPGIIATVHALGQLAYFTPKRPIHEKKDTTFR
jgi:uncharacterized membrane protein